VAGMIARAAKSGSLALHVGLREIPGDVWRLDSLRLLDVSRNALETFNDGGEKAWTRKLKKLRVAENRIQSISLEGLDALEELDMTSNALSAEAIVLLPRSLRVLSLANNPLHTLPPAVRSCSLLRTLNVSGTSLHSLPPWLVELRDLAELVADDNPGLQTLDTLDWALLPNLHTLSLCRTGLTGRPSEFPPSLFRSTALHTLRLDGAPIVLRLLHDLDGFDVFEHRKTRKFARGDRVE
jgi:Leucine-rich repeat (LRR) protein